MRRIFLIFVFGSAIVCVLSQNDWGSSLTLGLRKKFIPQLTLSLEEDFRLRSDFSEADRFSTSLELNYKPWQYLKIGGAYNLINFNHEKKDGRYGTDIIFCNRFIFYTSV